MSLTEEELLKRVDKVANKVIELIQNYDFDSFLIGVRLPAGMDQSLKKSIASEIGKQVSSTLGKSVDFSKPDITVIIDYASNQINPTLHLDIRSLYIYGEYQKLSRDLPQTKWICPKCHGKGCPYCHFMGKLYPTSVEEEIGKVFLDLTGGNGTKFHGAGREDRDALMLGWRPFVIEITNPVVRKIDLAYAQELINQKSDKVNVQNLRFVDKQKVVELKSAKYDKTYEAVVVCDKDYDVTKLEQLSSFFVNKQIEQRTPTRVAHRRSDLIRKKTVYSVECYPIDNRTFRAIIKAESGTYIKEFVSGDNGRTIPSIAEILGVPCFVKELNVLEVHVH